MQQKPTTRTRPIYIGFASQKGGVGKSTLAEVLASILYYERGVSLLVVDCDGTQESFFKLRERERKTIESSAELSEFFHSYFSRLAKPAYPILRSHPSRAIAEVNTYLSSYEPPEVIIFDFPGHAGSKELLTLSVEMDFIVSPIEADPQSLVSSFAYAQTIRDLGVGLQDCRIQELVLLWNKVNRSASTRIIDSYSSFALEEEIPLFTSRIYSSVKVCRELSQGGVRSLFRSSYLPPAMSLRSPTGIDVWIDELVERFGIPSNLR